MPPPFFRMDIKHFYPATTITEVEKYGNVRFTPINIDYFIRLMDWHQKSFDDVQKALIGASGQSGDVKSLLLLQEVLVAMIHTATYPFMQDSVSFESWKGTVTGWVIGKPKLIEWFLNYFQSFMPEVKKGKSETPSS